MIAPCRRLSFEEIEALRHFADESQESKSPPNELVACLRSMGLITQKLGATVITALGLSTLQRARRVALSSERRAFAA